MDEDNRSVTLYIQVNKLTVSLFIKNIVSYSIVEHFIHDNKHDTTDQRKPKHYYKYPRHLHKCPQFVHKRAESHLHNHFHHH